MKERPILFNGEMVRALLSGTKTQTRRQVKPQTVRESLPHEHLPRWIDSSTGEVVRCPYGQPGDRLWVRESFRFPQSLDDLSPAEIGEKSLAAGYRKPWCPTEFSADGYQTSNWIGFETPPNLATPGRYRASMHLPRWASRILLEIVSVRIERLNDISEGDCIAEGIEKTSHGFWSTYQQTDVSNGALSPKQSYQCLWESINGSGSWSANPLLWVIEFKRIKGVSA